VKCPYCGRKIDKVSVTWYFDIYLDGDGVWFRNVEDDDGEIEYRCGYCYNKLPWELVEKLELQYGWEERIH